MVGDWKAGTISMLGFWDNHTGDYVGATSGLAIFFTFEPNGEYSMLLYVLQRPLAWCVTQAWTELRGTVEFDGGTFVTNPTVVRYKASDNCSSENNFDRAATTDELLDERRTYYWAFEPDEYGKTYMRIGFDLANRDAWNWFEQSD